MTIPVAPAHARVLVTGATGLLGSTLVPVLRSSGCEVFTSARGGDVSAPADLSINGAAEHLLARFQPTAVVHLAAATDVDLCEREPQLAYRQNVMVVDKLAQACSRAETAVWLLYFSTDHVYDGVGSHAEDDVTVRNHYAMSKLAGEYAALRHPGCTVLRVNFVGRSRRPGCMSFSDWVVDALRVAAPFQVFDDVWFSPLRMATLSHAVSRVIARPATGVFNLGARGSITKAGLAQQLAHALAFDARPMQAASIRLRAGLAPRPTGMGMDSSRFEKVFALTLPRVEDEVQALSEEYLNEV